MLLIIRPPFPRMCHHLKLHDSKNDCAILFVLLNYSPKRLLLLFIPILRLTIMSTSFPESEHYDTGLEQVGVLLSLHFWYPGQFAMEGGIREQEHAILQPWQWDY